MSSRRGHAVRSRRRGRLQFDRRSVFAERRRAGRRAGQSGGRAKRPTLMAPYLFTQRSRCSRMLRTASTYCFSFGIGARGLRSALTGRCRGLAPGGSNIDPVGRRLAMRQVCGIVVALSVLLGGAVGAAARCGAKPRDAPAVAAVESVLPAQCRCCGHVAKYRRCVASVASTARASTAASALSPGALSVVVVRGRSA